MSFGLAFAQGLVGGFTKNIEREQIARDADDQRLAGLQDMVLKGTIKSAQDGTPMPKQIGDILRKAKEDMSKRPDIGPFGRGKADRLNLDFAELSANLNGASAKRQLQLGGGAYKIDIDQNYFDKSVFGKNQMAETGYYFNAVQQYLMKKGNFQKLKTYMEKNPKQLEAFKKEFDKNSGAYTYSRAKEFTSEGQPITNLPIIGDQYSSIGMLNNLFADGPDVFSQKIEAFEKVQVDKATTSNPDEKVVAPKNTIYLEGIKGEKNTLFSFQFQDQQDPLGMNYAVTADMKYMALGQLADRNGFRGPNAHSRFINYFRKELELAPKKISGFMLPLADGDSEQKTDANKIRESYKMMFHAINLQIIGSNKKISNMVNGEDVATLNYLNENFGSDDQFNQVNALASVLEVPESDILQLNTKQKGYTSAGGLTPIADKLKAIIGITPTEFNEKYAAGKRTRDGMQQLKKLKGGERTSTGAIQTLKGFVTNLTGDTGTIDQLGDLLVGGKGNTPSTNAAAIKAVLYKLTKDGNQSYIRDVGNITAQEALMITLAADMARAVDPAGRLSNQDFEMQLKKLGAANFFSSKVSEMISFEVVIADFEKQMRRIDSINKVIGSTSDNYFTKRELQVLYANKKYNALRDGQPAEEVKPTERSFFDPKETYTDNNGNDRPRFIPQDNGTFIDRKTQKVIPADKFIDNSKGTVS